MVGDNEDALKEQLESLEGQLSQLTALLTRDVVDSHSPLVQLQDELKVTIDGIRWRLSNQTRGHAAPADVEELPTFTVGDVCLAPRVFDRRRARAIVEKVDSDKGTCLVTWVYPRQKGELPCRYWKEGSCKFSGPNCSFSHGVELSLADLLPDKNQLGLKPATATAGNSMAVTSSKSKAPTSETNEAAEWLRSLDAGSRVLARYHDRVWYKAVVSESTAAAAAAAAGDGSLCVRFDGFEDEGPVCIPADTCNLAPLGESDSSTAGSRAEKDNDRIAPVSAAAEDSGEDNSDLEDAWADAPDLLGPEEVFFMERILGGRKAKAVVEGSRQGKAGGGGGQGFEEGGDGAPRDEVYVVGDWEQHTKGFGSRMMARMGYRRGEGLGKAKQGIARPVTIRVLPERCSLDHLRGEDDIHPKANSRGGPRRKKKSKNGSPSAVATAAARDEPQKAMFDFLNVTIHASAKGSGEGGQGGGRASGSSANSVNFLSSSSSQIGGRSSLANRRPIFDLRKKHAAHPDSAAAKNGGKAAGGGGGSSSTGRVADKMTKSELRAHLVGAREAETALAAKIVRLEETVTRNSERDPRVAAQARQKLEEVRAQAREVRASREKAERILGDRADRGKGGGKGRLFAF